MKVYTNISFKGYWPVGSVVFATSKLHAANLLNNELEKIGLKQIVYADDMIRMKNGVRILNDGNY